MLVEEESENLECFLDYFDKHISGTMVIIEDLDNLMDLQNKEKSKNNFYKICFYFKL